MKRRSGFTLIEMMIVLAIIAALAATLVPIAMNALNQAKVTQNLTDLESIRMAAMQYYYKNDTVDDLTGLSDLQYYLSSAKLSSSANYTLTTDSATEVTVNVSFTQGNAKNYSEALYVQYPNTDETYGTITTDASSGNVSFTAYFIYE